MTIKSCFIRLFLVAALSAALSAQATREHSLVLKNWPAPLYWQPSPAETEAAGDKASTLVRPLAVSGSLVFVAITPCRVVDTRASQAFPSGFGQPSLTPGPARSFAIQSSTLCSIPPGAQAYSFNVTVVPPGVLGYLKIYPTGVPEPNAVTLDDLLGTIVNNAVIVPAGTPNGSVSAVVNGNTDLVMDINGYYVLPNPTVNTATGLNALFSNTSGIGNTADGYGALYNNSAGINNTAVGGLALTANTTGIDNTAIGMNALANNTVGYANTAAGFQALLSNTQAYGNTGFGSQALQFNSTGIGNTAVGDSALVLNTADGNTAIGYAALYNNTNGTNNTGMGYNALYHNTTSNNGTAASQNTAIGASALYANTTGANDTAIGASALGSNTTGPNNTAVGDYALSSNITGEGNTAIGWQALLFSTGTGNIAVGSNAGTEIGGDNNIDIGNPGAFSESGVIRIGLAPYQTAFFAAGIRGVGTGQPNAVPVVIDSNGQLGTANSSRRFKEDIEDMNDASSGLLKLRPVTYRYRRPYADGAKPIDYGLIAEEVAEVYPDLVVKGADGQVETVQYQKLTPMLLNELQKQSQTIQSQQTRIAALEKALDTLLSGLAVKAQ